jgi:putative hydrolase of the HAD superfamily
MAASALARCAEKFLAQCKELQIPMAVITDGRSITQRNKIRALKIEELFSDLLISEEFGTAKPDERNYRYFENKYPNRQFYYFGDNTSKDFIVPQKLGWTSICVKDAGRNIHKQNIDELPKEIYFVQDFCEIELIKN